MHLKREGSTPTLRPHVDPHRLRGRVLTAVVAALLLCGAVGGYLTLARQHPIYPAGARARGGAGSPATAPTPVPATGQVAPITPTADPRTFAVEVAHALFDWDTAAMVPLSDYTGRLLAVADPTGEESPGLVADLGGYLPTAAVWAQLRPYHTRQWIQISSVRVPGLWPRAVAEAGPAGLRPGTTADTITGVRHRAGVWDGGPVSTAHRVEFTVFIVCRPSYPTCHLLRLSMLDDPLA